MIVLTEKELIDYLVQNRVPWSLDDEMFISEIPNKDIESWIISRINTVLKLGYLRGIAVDKRWLKIPQLKGLSSGLYFIPEDVYGKPNIKIQIPNFDVVHIGIHSIVNIEETFSRVIETIREEKNKKIDSLMIELGKETETLDEIEEKIKTWWPGV